MGNFLFIFVVFLFFSFIVVLLLLFVNFFSLMLLLLVDVLLELKILNVFKEEVSNNLGIFEELYRKCKGLLKFKLM